MKKIFILLVATLLQVGLVCAEATPPIERVRVAIDEVVDALKVSHPNPESKKKTLLAIVDKVFDFEEMSKRSLGSAWLKYETSEQQAFVLAFSDFLAKTYLNRIEKVTKDTVKVLSEQIKGDKALVKTEVKLKESDFPIDYKMHLKTEGWEVYDVVIENVGLVANYRNEFAGFLRKEDLNALTQKLIQKTASLK